MSDRTGSSRDPSAWLSKWDPLPRLAFAAVLAFMVGGLVGGATSAPGVGPSLDVLLVNGRNYAVLLLTLLVVGVGYVVGRRVGGRR